MSASPAALLDRLRGGDAAAAAALARTYFPVFRVLALAGTLDGEGAAEVIRKGLAVFRDRLGEAATARDLLPLAELLAREEIRRWLRRKGGRRSEVVGIPVETARRVRGPTVAFEAAFGDLPPESCAYVLLEAASWLPEAYQAPFLLRYLDNQPVETIAELAGIPVRDVGTSLAAARRLYEREIVFQMKKIAQP